MKWIKKKIKYTTREDFSNHNAPAILLNIANRYGHFRNMFLPLEMSIYIRVLYTNGFRNTMPTMSKIGDMYHLRKKHFPILSCFDHVGNSMTISGSNESPSSLVESVNNLAIAEWFVFSSTSVERRKRFPGFQLIKHQLQHTLSFGPWYRLFRLLKSIIFCLKLLRWMIFMAPS